MTNYRINIMPEAVADLNNIYFYIKTNLGEEEIAKKQYKRIIEAIYSLRLFPNRIKELSYFYKGIPIRRLIVDNYSVMFRVNENKVEILKVFSNRQDIEEQLENKLNKKGD